MDYVVYMIQVNIHQNGVTVLHFYRSTVFMAYYFNATTHSTVSVLSPHIATPW